MADDGGQKVCDPLGHRYAVAAVLAAVGGHGVVDNPIDAGPSCALSPLWVLRIAIT